MNAFQVILIFLVSLITGAGSVLDNPKPIGHW